LRCSNALSGLIWVWSHEDQQGEPLLRRIAHTVVDPRWRKHNLIAAEIAFLIANLEPANTLEHNVDFVGALVRVRLLFLTRLETVYVREHPFALEEIYLPKFFTRETAFRFQVSGLHCDLRRGLK